MDQENFNRLRSDQSQPAENLASSLSSSPRAGKNRSKLTVVIWSVVTVALLVCMRENSCFMFGAGDAKKSVYIQTGADNADAQKVFSVIKETIKF